MSSKKVESFAEKLNAAEKTSAEFYRRGTGRRQLMSGTYCLKRRKIVMDAEGDFTMLPDSVLDVIVNFLDIETLAACCCSCREWYGYLNANESNWEKACKNFGLKETKDTLFRLWDTWKEYALLFLKRLKEMRNSECFRESSFSIDMTDDGEVQAIYYYKNRLAVATASKIEMWSTTSNSFIFDIINSPEASLCNISIKFDDVYIMVGDISYKIRCFDVLSRTKEVVYGGENAEVTSYDFESRCDIVVGRKVGGNILIWKISTGRLIRTLKMLDPTGLDVNVKIVFIHSPSTNEKGLFYLLYLDRWRLFVWTVSFSCVTSESGIEYRENPDIFNINPPEWFKWNTALVSRLLDQENFVYYSQPSVSESCVINELDLTNGEISSKIETNEIIRSLLAVGEKYIAFHTTGQDGVGENVHVVEKTSSKLVARYQVPDDVNADNVTNCCYVVFCGEKCLDGFDLTNDGSCFLAYVREKMTVHFVEWIP